MFKKSKDKGNRKKRSQELNIAMSDQNPYKELERIKQFLKAFSETWALWPFSANTAENRELCIRFVRNDVFGSIINQKDTEINQLKSGLTHIIREKEEEISQLRGQARLDAELLRKYEGVVNQLREQVRQIDGHQAQFAEQSNQTIKHAEITQRQEINKLKSQINQDAQTIQKKEEEINRLRDQLRQYAETIRHKEGEISYLRSDMKDKEEENVHVRKENAILKNKLDASKIQTEPVDVAGIENVNSKNRPTQVADAYINLMNYQWLDALIELGSYPEHKRFELLLQIMKIARQEADSYLDEAERNIVALMDDPFSPRFHERLRHGQQNILPESTKRFAFGRMKENYSHHDIGPLIERANANVRRLIGKSAAGAEIAGYTGECCRVAWRMVLQQPKMDLAAQDYRLGNVLDPLKEDLYADSKPRGTISGYVKAGLVQGDKYFVKAIVCLN